jgi:hypothetical protein
LTEAERDAVIELVRIEGSMWFNDTALKALEKLIRLAQTAPLSPTDPGDGARQHDVGNRRQT